MCRLKHRCGSRGEVLLVEGSKLVRVGSSFCLWLGNKLEFAGTLQIIPFVRRISKIYQKGLR